MVGLEQGVSEIDSMQDIQQFIDKVLGKASGDYPHFSDDGEEDDSPSFSKQLVRYALRYDAVSRVLIVYL